MTIANRTIITTTNTETQVYSCFRKARAPFWISFIKNTIRSLPGGADWTDL